MSGPRQTYRSLSKELEGQGTFVETGGCVLSYCKNQVAHPQHFLSHGCDFNLLTN